MIIKVAEKISTIDTKCSEVPRYTPLRQVTYPILPSSVACWYTLVAFLRHSPAGSLFWKRKTRLAGDDRAEEQQLGNAASVAAPPAADHGGASATSVIHLGKLRIPQSRRLNLAVTRYRVVWHGMMHCWGAVCGLIKVHLLHRYY